MNAIAGKHALVTGATSGIGLAIATALASAGARVTITGLGDAKQIAAALQTIGGTAEHHPADMREPEQTRAMMRDITTRAGAVEILVNNAGIQHTARTEDFPPDKWDAILAVNLSSAFHTAAAALPAMRERNYGRIINIASVHGLVASKEKAAYVAAKHGLIGLTKVIALETAEADITCNAICPGWVLTPLIQAQIDTIAATRSIPAEAAAEALLREKEPSRRFTKPEDIAAAVLFLLSPAGDNITGARLAMDGGWTLP